MNLEKNLDTPNDFRILLAEKALFELEKLFNAIKLQRRKEYLKKLKTLVGDIQNVKYSYLSPKDLLNFDSFKKIVSTAVEIGEEVKRLEKDPITIQSLYWLEYLTNLSDLIRQGEISQPFEAIRFFRGEIVSRNKINDLWLCNADCSFKLNVVANNDDFKPGTMALIAYLPPRTFGKYLSQGMFVCMSEGEKGEVSLDEVKKMEGLGEVNSLIYELIKS
jgi:hypothetical protein